MISEQTINNLGIFLYHNDIKNENVFETYNRWATNNAIVIHDANDVQWVVNFIKDFSNANRQIIKEALAIRCPLS